MSKRWITNKRDRTSKKYQETHEALRREVKQAEVEKTLSRGALRRMQAFYQEREHIA